MNRILVNSWARRQGEHEHGHGGGKSYGGGHGGSGEDNWERSGENSGELLGAPSLCSLSVLPLCVLPLCAPFLCSSICVPPLCVLPLCAPPLCVPSLCFLFLHPVSLIMGRGWVVGVLFVLFSATSPGVHKNIYLIVFTLIRMNGIWAFLKWAPPRRGVENQSVCSIV